ncbi:hypothetical protein D6745_04730 [Candidatus Woesearchaeota archaeon]|nr:MAG: hypothetical protein D6745_04730 [Candidatus Woesearchaeota archaeon]
MVNFAFIMFAFSAGTAAFFAPCSATLLPGYITYYFSKNENQATFWKSGLRGLLFGLGTILGFFAVFGIAGALIILLGQAVKQFIPWVAMIFGAFLIFAGAAMLLGKDFFVKLPKIISRMDSSSFVFGIAYAIASLGCTFPLFATVLLQGITDTSLIGGLASLLAYIIGISIVMLGITFLTAVSREFVQKKIMKLMPYIKKASALIIIVAGAYMIYYQFFVI